jgi:hypothetical protein
MGKDRVTIEGFLCVYLAEKHPPNIHVPGRETSRSRVIIGIVDEKNQVRGEV